MAEIVIDYEKCEGKDCADCASFCPMEVFIINGDKIVAQNQEECSECDICIDICQSDAIKIVH